MQSDEAKLNKLAKLFSSCRLPAVHQAIPILPRTIQKVVSPLASGQLQSCSAEPQAVDASLPKSWRP